MSSREKKDTEPANRAGGLKRARGDESARLAWRASLSSDPRPVTHNAFEEFDFFSCERAHAYSVCVQGFHVYGAMGFLLKNEAAVFEAIFPSFPDISLRLKISLTDIALPKRWGQILECDLPGRYLKLEIKLELNLENKKPTFEAQAHTKVVRLPEATSRARGLGWHSLIQFYMNEHFSHGRRPRRRVAARDVMSVRVV